MDTTGLSEGKNYMWLGLGSGLDQKPAEQKILSRSYELFSYNLCVFTMFIL